MKKIVDFSLILACYNETDVFTESVHRIIDVLSLSTLQYEIIFVDDASRDGTQKLIKNACKKLDSHPRGNDKGRYRAIYHAVNQGRGKTVSDGIEAATGSVVGYIDIDCEVSPVYMPLMVSLILKNQADVVIGKRMYRTSPGSVLREVLSRGYQWLSDKLIGTGGMDTETGYKFFNKKKIAPILGHIEHQGWFWDTEIMVYAKRAKLRIIEIPVLFLRRFDKQSSVNILGDTLDYVRNLWKFRMKLVR